MATIHDVAKLAGVSTSTVSRVLNDGGASDEAKSAVLNAMKELDYSPSFFAQSIKTRRTNTIAMIVPDISNLFYTEMFKAIEEVALKHNYIVLMCDTKNNAMSEIKYAKTLLNRSIDGFIYCSYQKVKENEEYFVELSKTFPLVFMDYAFINNNDVPFVVTEGKESTANAVEYLCETGKNRIAYVNFPKDTSITLPRYEGYMEGLKKCTISINDDYVITPEPNNDITLMEIGYQSAERLMSLRERPNAIMTAADPLAIGVLKYLKEKQIKIPDDVSVIGFDNSALCDIYEPKLTTISQPIKEMGKSAATILLAKIQGIDLVEDQKMYRGKLIVGETT